MLKHFLAPRPMALALLALASACGADSGDDDVSPDGGAGHHDASTDAGHTGDAGSHDGGHMDGGVRDAALIDAGLTHDASDAHDGGLPDGGSAELERALETEGVHVSMERAELLIAALCHATAACSPGPVNEQQCIMAGKLGWSDPMFYEPDAFDCLDATLDLTACSVSSPCNASACRSFTTVETMKCSPHDAGL